MGLTEITVEGTLKPDGTLELDHKPNLGPGRVKVTLPGPPPGSPICRGGSDVNRAGGAERAGWPARRAVKGRLGQ
jgi:hypothetical protein